MGGRKFELTEDTLSVIEEIGADGKRQKSVVPVPFPLLAVRGVGGPDDEEQRRGKDVLRVGDHVMARKSEKYGNYLEVFTPYWKEIARSGFLEVPLMPGSVSLWGSDAGRHWEFAQEICAVGRAQYGVLFAVPLDAHVRHSTSAPVPCRQGRRSSRPP